MKIQSRFQNNFVFLHSFFDKDEYLSQYDLIPFYSTWDGHSTQITVKQFFELCQDIGIDEKNILCTYRERINDSNHKEKYYTLIVPIVMFGEKEYHYLNHI